MTETFSGLTCDVQTLSPTDIKVTFQCQSGKITALLGASGAGKTTLLKMLAGLIKPQQGKIQLGNTIWADTENKRHLSPQQRHIGYVPQHFGLFEHQTALENILSGLNHLPKAERLHRAKDWLALVGLSQSSHKRPSQLSGGQRQRVALARALAREPDLLLLDEPFSAVDPQTRKQLHLQLVKLKSRIHCPVVMVTHNIQEAQLLADHLVLIDNGKILQQGETDAVTFHPNSIRAAHLLGHQNVVYGTVIRHEPQTKQTWLQLGNHQICINDHQHRSITEKVTCLLPNELMASSGSASIQLPLHIHSQYQQGHWRHILATVEGDDTPLTIITNTRETQIFSKSQWTWQLTPTDIQLF